MILDPTLVFLISLNEDVIDGLNNRPFAFAPSGTLFGPSGSYIDAIDGIYVGSGRSISAVSDAVGFEKTGLGFVP